MTPVTNETPTTEVKLITKDELRKKIDGNDSAQILNVLGPEHYSLGMIKSSKRIALDQLEARIGELDKSREVITYCAGKECNSSKQAAKLLVDKGFRASAYEGGLREWKDSMLPIEG